MYSSFYVVMEIIGHVWKTLAGLWISKKCPIWYMQYLQISLTNLDGICKKIDTYVTDPKKKKKKNEYQSYGRELIKR